MYSVLEAALIYLCLLCRIAHHGSRASTCNCPETCATGIDDQPPMSCLFHANHSSLTARRPPKWVLPLIIDADSLCDTNMFAIFSLQSGSLHQLCHHLGSSHARNSLWFCWQARTHCWHVSNRRKLVYRSKPQPERAKVNNTLTSIYVLHPGAQSRD